jgi:hypothetical protein
LMESSMAAVSVWTFYFLLRLYHRPRILYVVASGAILGIGYFIKSTALVFLAQFIFLYFFFLTLRRREPIRYINLFLIFLSAFILVNLPLFFRAQFWATLPMSVRYSFSLAELSKLPFPQWFTNLRIMLDLILVNLTPPLLIAFLIGSYLLLRRRKFTLLTLILWVVLSLIHTVIFARSVNFRYLEPYLPLTVIPAAFVLVSRRALAAVTLGIGGAVCLLQTVSPPDYFRFMSHITRYSYIEGYVTGDSTGYQVMESVKYFEKLAQKQPIIIGIALNVGNPEGALLVFLRRNPNIVMTYMDAQMLGGVTKNFDCLTSQTPLYFLAREKQQAGLDKFFTPVATITNSYNSDYHTVYTLNPDCTGKTFPIALTKH